MRTEDEGRSKEQGAPRARPVRPLVDRGTESESDADIARTSFPLSPCGMMSLATPSSPRTYLEKGGSSGEGCAQSKE